MRSPDFLVVGAQKCGTTTLYEDLRSHPRIRLAPKEHASLLDAPRVGAVSNDGLFGEVSTKYTRWPHLDAASTASAHMHPGTRIIYIVRDPIQRALSHHRHLVAEGRVADNVDAALNAVPDIMDFSRYGSQLRPWIRQVGRAAVLAVRFEDYMHGRQEGADRVFSFLGLSSHTLPDPELVSNQAESKRVARGVWRKFWASPVYQRGVRQLLPVELRRGLYTRLLPPPPPKPAPPSASSLQRLVAELQPEVRSLAELLGTEEWWDLAASHGELG